MENNVGIGLHELGLPVEVKEYVNGILKDSGKLREEVEGLIGMGMEGVNKRLGVDMNKLPYEILRVLFPDGSDHAEVGKILSKKREEYLKTHPEEQVAKGASKGVITCDGMFVSQDRWDQATPAERRTILVGRTCFHWNSDTPGMGDDDSRELWELDKRGKRS
jgi:hypothetical protein